MDFFIGEDHINMEYNLYKRGDLKGAIRKSLFDFLNLEEQEMPWRYNFDKVIEEILLL